MKSGSSSGKADGVGGVGVGFARKVRCKGEVPSFCSRVWRKKEEREARKRESKIKEVELF